MELIEGFTSLLGEFRVVFTVPSFAIFVDLVTGWVLSHRHRFVTDLIVSSGSVAKRHFSDCHRFFSQYSWDLDSLSMCLFLLLVRVFAPVGVIELAVDDTLARKRGLLVYGTGMHHDPLMSSRAKTITSWGHDWVVLTLVIRNPWWAPSKVFSCPICFRLYRNRQGVTKGKKHTPKQDAKQRRQLQRRKKQPRGTSQPHRTRPELAVEMLQLVASWLPDREFIVTGDSAYGGASVLQKLPANMDLISHVHPKGALYEPAPAVPPGTKKRGRGRKKGQRLPGMTEWAANKTKWRTLKFDQYGFHATVQVKVIKALYYKSGKDRLLVIILVRDTLGKRPDQMFYCTRLDWDARQILSTYAGRWSIEVTFHDCKQLLGFEDPANRIEKAVRRTAPMAMVLYSIIVVWFHREGHHAVEFPERPWYRRKAEPSFGDMLTTLRRESWKHNFGDGVPTRGRAKKVLDQITWILSLAG
jgi:DDE superfamily endonuclease